MRRIAVVIVVAVPSIALSLACRKQPAHVDEESRVVAPAGPHPLAEYCGEKPCRSYTEAVTVMKQRATSGGMCLDAHLAACGGIRDVELGDGYSRWEEWFDASGKMIGAKVWADYRPEGGDYGSPPPCKLEVTERLCPPPAVLDAGAG